jgi:hypothetical protein
MLARRLLILLAVLMGLTALASGLAPRQPVTRTAPQPSPTGVVSTPEPPVEATLDAAMGAPQRIVVREGRTLILQVGSDEPDSVTIEGLGRIEVVDPDSPARFELLAEPAGSYAIELVDARRTIGMLEIR